MLPSLGALTRSTLRLWRLDGAVWHLCAGETPAVGGRRDSTARVAVPGAPGIFLEIAPASGAERIDVTAQLLAVAQRVIDDERSAAALTSELAARYEEIDLLYTIGELLGRSRPVADVAAIILREVTSVIGARQAALRVHDDATGMLRSVASLGTDPARMPQDVDVADAGVVVARAFQSGRIETGTQANWVPGEVVAVPISYAAPGQPARVIGTLALADRAGGGRFTREETRLIAAVATQIGAALENARLVELEREQQRLEHELELAHDLQLRLMPTPAALRGDADVSVRSEAAESVGGDFYTFARLGRGRVGIMLGDVASHGLSAALIAAEVLAAAGIHANSTTPPDEMLTLLRDSLAAELEKTEMFLTIFYGILDPGAGRLIYASAGHQHAFRLPAVGHAERLAPTAPPLGLVETGRFGREMVRVELRQRCADPVHRRARSTRRTLAGERYGEARLLACIESTRALAPADVTHHGIRRRRRVRRHACR